MSGGVDSSVAAAFLKKKGYEVIGITMRFWGDENRCCSPDDVEDARQVARIIGIPHYVISMHDAFKKEVVDYFISEYIHGRTPNPCAVCNPAIKFGKLLEKARELKAEYLATGHYAVTAYDRNRRRFVLKMGKERGKDQSYFLARLSQEILKHALFPVGNFPKHKIRKLADQFNLPVAAKSESQEVCFVANGELARFIEQYGNGNPKPGNIVNNRGEIIGTHSGIHGYTIGQRKGLGIALGERAYVTRIDAPTRTIVVGDRNDLYHKRFIATQAHWISVPPVRHPRSFRVRIRYMHKPADAQIMPLDHNNVEVVFDTPQRAITPGQLAVFYDNDLVAGSAWISRVAGSA